MADKTGKKPAMQYLNPQFLLALGRVMGKGAEKHGAWSFQREDPDLALAAAMRHLLAIQQGEVIDPESGEEHAAHVAANAMILFGKPLNCNHWSKETK